MAEFDSDSLLTHTQSLLDHVFWFQHDFGFQPKRDHHGTAINFVDVSERRSDFLHELKNTISSWVYSRARTKEIIDARLASVGNDSGNAAMFLSQLAMGKFRKGHPQGQFGELLLFNFIQHFFKAVPLLRKMPITTSTGHERFGADAVHYRSVDGENIFYLGESKCYESSYKFKTAFDQSITSIVATFDSFFSELQLYTYEDFIEGDLKDIAKRLKEGKLTDVKFELVCLVMYNETNDIDGDSEEDIKKNIQKVIVDRCTKVDPSLTNTVKNSLLTRMNFVAFPVWKLDSLLEDFENS